MPASLPTLPPLFSAEESAARWSQTLLRVTIKGQDVSSRFKPIIISLKVGLKSGGDTDIADLELDDTDGQIIFPDQGDDIEIDLGTVHTGMDTAFRGKLDEPRSTGSRGDGRKMILHAKGMDAKSKVKEQQEAHWDDKELGEVLEEAGKLAGLEKVIIDPDLAKLKRKYWAMQGESFIAFGQRVAREVGGTFKVVGNQALIVKRNGGTSATGQPLPTITAKWGDNLINWDISPRLGRSRYKKVKARYFDKQKGKWEEREVEIKDEGAEAAHSVRYSKANKDEAEAQAKADATEAERNKGGGSILIDGNTEAQPECLCNLVGARDGIDGGYRVDGVDHEVTRSNGFTSNLTLKQPQGDSGTDKRGKSGDDEEESDDSDSPDSDTRSQGSIEY